MKPILLVSPRQQDSVPQNSVYMCLHSLTSGYRTDLGEGTWCVYYIHTYSWNFYSNVSVFCHSVVQHFLVFISVGPTAFSVSWPCRKAYHRANI